MLKKFKSKIATNKVDRVGDIIAPEAISDEMIEEYMKNPVLKLNFNRTIGKVTKLERSPEGLRVEGEITDKGVWNSISKESLKSVGISGKVKKNINLSGGINVIKEFDLQEISIIDMPINKDQLINAGFLDDDVFTPLDRMRKEYRATIKELKEDGN